MSLLELENQQLRELSQLQKQEIDCLKEEINQLRKLLFSARRERFVPAYNSAQGTLFGDETVEQVVPQTKEIIQEKIISKPKQRRKSAGRNSFPQTLDRETINIDPDDLNLEQLTKIGEDVTELLAYKPASLYVKKIVRGRYADKSNEDRGIFQAPIPPRIIPKGMVDESLIAEMISEKIQFHTPLFRFAKKLKAIDVDFISENNLYNWFHKSAESLTPIYNLLVEQILNQPYIQADETRLTVLAKNKKGSSHRGYMWVMMSPKLRAVAFHYDPSRSTEAAVNIFKNYKGTLQADGYNVYDLLSKVIDIILIYCMAHARRKFVDAQQSDPELANYYLSRVQQLYDIEHQAREQNLNEEQRLDLRQKHAVPILEELRTWLTHQRADKNILPKSLIGKAIEYSYKRWEGLCEYAKNGQLEIDNNLIENTIRPIALGRKNYLFAKSHDTAQNLAVLYSLVGTCLKNDIDPRRYLHWLLKKVAANKVTPEAVDWLPHRIDSSVLEEF